MRLVWPSILLVEHTDDSAVSTGQTVSKLFYSSRRRAARPSTLPDVCMLILAVRPFHGHASEMREGHVAALPGNRKGSLAQSPLINASCQPSVAVGGDQ